MTAALSSRGQLEGAATTMGGCMAGMGFLGIFGILLIILAVLAIVWLARSLKDRNGNGHAEQVLRREYASGLIDQDEYQRRRAHLGLRQSRARAPSHGRPPDQWSLAIHDEARCSGTDQQPFTDEKVRSA